MNADILELLKSSLTPYHAVKEAEKLLLQNGFEKLEESEKWNIKKHGKYYVVRDGSALIAFKTGEDFSFTITASHTDSPCFKLKGGNEFSDGNYLKFNVEKYGGGFALFIRKRTYVGCQKKYMAWERKRGGILNLCRFAAGGEGEDEESLPRSRDCRPDLPGAVHRGGMVLHGPAAEA